MAERRRRIETETIGEVTVVTFKDEKIMDEQQMQTIGEQLFALVDTDGVRQVVLDFVGVTYLSSAILGKFMTLQKKLQHNSGKLVLCSIIPGIYEVFEITKLDKFFRFAQTLADALKKI